MRQTNFQSVLQTPPYPKNRTKSGRLKMLLLLLVCASPVIASYVSYHVIKLQGQTNLGILVPQVSAPSLTATTIDGKTIYLPALKGQWLLVSASGGACNAQCQEHLYLQRQLRETFGKEKGRIDWIWFVTDDAPIDAKLIPALQTATVLRLSQQQLSTWLQPAIGNVLSDHLYVVDPMTNWMMRFPADFSDKTATLAKKDLTRLLTCSASWDREGR